MDYEEASHLRSTYHERCPDVCGVTGRQDPMFGCDATTRSIKLLPTPLMKRFVGVVVFSFVLVYFQPEAFALRVNPAAYPYPYENPYIATTTLSILKGRNAFSTDDAVSRRSFEIKLLDHRDNVYLLEGMGKLRVRF
ncbi:MAG: hypothetical protein MN733_13635, partial [Nitrososphaera sp.]|nr:hypothetical protein [Nitrososphaera sp.]